MSKAHMRILILVGLIILGYFLISSQYSGQKESITTPPIQSSTECSGQPTPVLTEGPYYKVGSPEKTDLSEEGVVGELLTLTGYVFDINCQAIANAWLDFWQADGNGVYDNAGYRLRGHQFTDNDGKYILETVVPARYSGRTPHIHVKVRADSQSPILTSQLYFSGGAQNQTDPIFSKDPLFNQSLVVDIKDVQDGKQASFNFVLNH